MKRRAVFRVGLWVVLLLVVAVGMPPSISFAGRPVAAAPFGVSFTWSPSTVTVNMPTQGMVTFSGGATPFRVWLNQTPPGCAPQQIPFVTSNYSESWNCSPTSSGTYDVHLDAVDNTGTRQSATATLTVQSGGGNGGGGGGNGTNPLSGLQDLLPIFYTFAIIFLGSLVALAVGVMLMAMLVSRRLRQLTEAMKGGRAGPKSPDDAPEEKPPT